MLLLKKLFFLHLKLKEAIEYLKEKELFTLLDEKTQVVAEYRYKYPELSYQELATVITTETNYKIGKNNDDVALNLLIKSLISSLALIYTIVLYPLFVNLALNLKYCNNERYMV